MNAAAESSGRWQTFCAAPHRMFFFGGTIALLLATLFWLADYTSIFLVARPLLAANVNDLYAHGIILALGVFPLFISGFILTTFPRWMSQPPIGRIHYATAAILQTGGTLLVLVGLLMGNDWIRTGFLLTALGWLIVLRALGGVFIRANERPIHAWILLPALIAGFCLTVLLAAQSFPLQGTWPAVPRLAIWWVLLPVFLGVCHRMIPFFSKNVIPGYRMQRPAWLLWTMCGLIVVRPLLPSSGWVILAVDLSLFAGALILWLIWMPWQRFSNRLLLILHLGFAWLWIAFLLDAVNDLCRFLAFPQLLWKAPLHAMTLGFLAVC